MTINKNKITIELEDKNDIETFNNVILFALDLDAKSNCMTESERAMAKKLVEQTDN